MVAPHQVELAYTVTAVGSITTAKLKAAMEAVVLYTDPSRDPSLCQNLALTVESDTTSIALNDVTRTLVLNMDPTAGAPNAPPYFVIHNQLDEGEAAVWSSSPGDTSTGAGAQQVSITYQGLTGGSQTVTVNLNGKTPVIITGMAASNIARVSDMHITVTGSLGSSFGQITVARFDPNAPSLKSPEGALLVNPNQDQLQGALRDKLGYLPPSYYGSFCTSGPGGGLSFDNMKAMVSNLFTTKLSTALASMVVAATPVLIP